RSICLLIFLFFLSIEIFGQVNRVEPPFWWSGMKMDTLQIMVYGEKINQLEPEINGIEILNVDTTENPNYLFITINTQDVPAGKFQIDFKKKNKVVFSQPYEFKEREENSALRKGFDSSDLIYLIMPDRFANGNEANDSHPDVVEKVNRSLQGGRHGGDIQGIINRLDYLDEIGVTAIWSTPLLEDNDHQYSYHTYAQSDVYKIDPR